MTRSATLDTPATRPARRRSASGSMTNVVATRPVVDHDLDGDASVHLEDLVVGDLARVELELPPQITVEIELVGPHLRVAGSMTIGHHRRLSDFINHHLGLLHIRGATVLRRNGDPTKVTTPSIWASPTEVTLIGQTAEEPYVRDTPPEFLVPKIAYTLVVVTSGHTLTGNVHIPGGAELSGFIESSDPGFIPMTDVRTRSLADRRIISRYPFALLNRRHIVAATELQPGMIPGRTVL
ncbi:MAG: DUF6812 domain-containing protein [Candidatus Limnocylindrales bacterium]